MNKIIKYIGAFVVLMLLMTSKRYREKWRETCSKFAEANDVVEASLRRIDAMHNGGKPKIRVL